MTERKIILKKMKKNNYLSGVSLFDDNVIKEISIKIERSEQGVKEEIKKMLFNEYIFGFSYEKLSVEYNIPIQNIKLLIKLYIEKNGKKIIGSIENENKLLKLQIENIKLRKELEQLNYKN